MLDAVQPQEPGPEQADHQQRRRLQDLVHLQLPVRGPISAHHGHRGGKNHLIPAPPPSSRTVSSSSCFLKKKTQHLLVSGFRMMQNSESLSILHYSSNILGNWLSVIPQRAHIPLTRLVNTPRARGQCHALRSRFFFLFYILQFSQTWTVQRSVLACGCKQRANHAVSWRSKMCLG